MIQLLPSASLAGFRYSIIPLLLIFVSSCAKEIYTDADAASAKREAQKVGLTVMIRDVGSRVTDMSGFTVTTQQCSDQIQGVSSTDGIVSLMVVKGDAVLRIEKEGYVSATAIVTTNATEKERNNTVVIIPMFSNQQASGSLYGMVYVKKSASEEPFADAPVSIDMDMNELMSLAFPDFGGNVGQYRPGALTYSSLNLLQPVRTDASGAFQLTIPITVADLTYTVKVHETAWTQPASRTVVTNGQNSPPAYLQLSLK